MTPRRRRLLRYGGGSTVLVAGIVALVVMTERRPSADPSVGLDDVLARDLPADLPPLEFVDVAAAAGIEFRHFSGTRSHMLPEDMGSGVAWGDCDDDGSPDLFVVNFTAPMGVAPEQVEQMPGSALFRNRGDGTFEPLSTSGAALRTRGLGAAWGDYDGDGDLDLYVTNYGANVLLRNEGGCRFTDVTEATGVAGDDAEFSAGASWGDYDQDGDVDLYVTNYVAFVDMLPGAARTSLQFGQAVPFTLNPASFEPMPNRLYRNDGGRFVDVAAAAGVDNAEGRSLSAAWCDFDADGDLDLYVANDISDNALYSNRGDGSFEDVSAATLTADYRGAMGLAVTDFDHDGDIDFFVTHWIAQENALYNNHLELGGESVFFGDVAEIMGLGYTGLDYVGWGTEFVDVDNDGYKDLVVANGHTLEDSEDPTRLVGQRMQLFLGRGLDGFFDVSDVAGPAFRELLVGRGAAAADYDGDGDVDIAVLAHGGHVRLLQNRSDRGHWIALDLRQPTGNRRALGARVEVVAGDLTQTHVVGASPSYLSQSDLTVHFGLGVADRVDRVAITWPDGARESWEGLTADRRYRIDRAGEPIAR